jgi:hypothetical protein
VPLDTSVARWTAIVPGRQWAREDAALGTLGEALPEVLGDSRPLAEVHRLDLALFVVFEEVALRVSGALTRRAPGEQELAFAAQQTLDEARHHEMFRRRFDRAAAAAGLPAGDRGAILIPPLRRFIDLCYEVADAGRFAEGLTLMNLVLEGMAYPLYAYEVRYWRPVDPYLAALIESAFADETRHVAFGAALVRAALAGDPAERARVERTLSAARAAMREVFRYYVRKFVGLFNAVARRHGALFAGAEVAPGRLIAATPYEEQIAIIQHDIDTGHARLLARAGLDAAA